MIHADLEREYFRRGREVLGKNVGGLLVRLLRCKQGDLGEAMKVIEGAALAIDARQYVAGACKYRAHDAKPAMTTVREKRLIAREIGRYYAHASSRQWQAWDRHLQAQGKIGAIRDRDGGWWFPTEWPPGHVGAAA